ncbi:MAG: hypothetical protein U0521_13105 [Anaerolineae bacterium]
MLPSIRIGDNGAYTVTGGELWISPARNAVVAVLSQPGRAERGDLRQPLPVSGQI